MLFEALYKLMTASLMTERSCCRSELIANSPMSLIAVSAVSLAFTMVRTSGFPDIDGRQKITALD
jgi:hypothetical protein